ncbi:hypothetical protein [Novilysobacter spongiicola]|uniref:Porin n=1 Tax=Lysobacter spongiicola DSM 21749 TaxID=1122188 RepID=A0A1T4MJ99_9GAMM|nr:hypothetical protein [Lysobacter spongiicola]SJZ66916.1 hypothetical protein SAMN02745674_00446 [Lysobacter spongiicola DSM 21749]
MAGLNGYRYVDPGLVSRLGVGAPADWGLHLNGRAGGGVDWALSAVTGAGFKRPDTDGRVNYEARVGWSGDGLTLAVGGYRGTRALADGTATRYHTARRSTAVVAWTDERFRLGAQFVRADNWNRVTSPLPDAARGWSAWGSYRIRPDFALFARHDRADPSTRQDPRRKDRYSQVGLEWRKSPHLRIALVGKRQESASPSRQLRATEVGIWGQLDF